MITSYSFITSVVIFNMFLIAGYLLRRKKHFIVRYGLRALLLVTLLATIRLFLPLDLAASIIIRSQRLLPVLEQILEYRPLEQLRWLTVSRAIAGIWLAGTAIYLVRDFLLMATDRRKRKAYIIIEDQHIKNLMCDLDIPYSVIVSPCVHTPHVAGIFSPQIYLPQMQLSDEEWRYVLRHEAIHIQSCDLWIKLFFRIIEAAFWWNPVSHMFMREVDTILELRCDAKLARALNDDKKIEYLDVMIKVLRQNICHGKDDRLVTASLVSPVYDLKQRFEMVMYYDRNSHQLSRHLLCACIVLVFVLSFFVVIQPAYFPPAEDLVNVVEVSPEGSFILYDGARYVLYVDGKMFDVVPENELSSEPYNELEIIISDGG